MIQQIKVKCRIPKKKLTNLFFPTGNIFTSSKHQESWKQYSTDSSDIFNIVASVLGIDVHKINNVIMHVLNSGDVPAHTDAMSTGVYLIPIKYTPTMTFYDTDREVHFKPGYAYKFNDYIRHGIDNEHNGKAILISVDTETKSKYYR